MCGPLGDRREQRHGRRPAADDHHTLVAVVEVGGPVLWVDNGTGEALKTLEVRRIAAVVTEVAGGEKEPRALDRVGAGAPGVRNGDRPQSLLARPGGGHRSLPVANVRLDPVLGGRLADVLEDRRTVGDRLIARATA